MFVDTVCYVIPITIDEGCMQAACKHSTIAWAHIGTAYERKVGRVVRVG
jgi:hypothetical protein